MFVNAKHSDWDDVIDHVVFAYNSSRHESTGVSPFYMLYGREPRLPIDVALGNNPNSPSSHFDFILGLPLLGEKVKRRILMIQHRQKERYDRRHRHVSLNPGDLVWVFKPDRIKGRSEKLLHRYHGPFKIIRNISEVNYLIETIRCRRKRIECVHVSRLKTFVGRPHFLQV